MEKKVKLVITETTTVEGLDAGVARWIANAMTTGNTAYTEGGYGPGDLGAELTTEVTAEVV